eukprot:CAMPEP_0176191086 /NCGR_PEP_ID=MMETSP0121_2-20121125/4283_1 /TAXON_ID=160619 /ORGANISM="Kryptoperidinium foliaceum, Strain CCMP 1326" /LENGTH=223 /DNA_ID=CAMNT_0017529749 /DNA_START=173 /DNA_END=840 /DNA_ORIENTATION=-
MPSSGDDVLLHAFDIDLDKAHVVDGRRAECRGGGAAHEQQLVQRDLRDQLGRGVPVVELHGLLLFHAVLLVPEPHAAGRGEEPQLGRTGLELAHLGAESHREDPDVAEAVDGHVRGHELLQPTEGLEGEDLAAQAHALAERNCVAAEVRADIDDDIAWLKQRLHLVRLQRVHRAVLLHPMPDVRVVEWQREGMRAAGVRGRVVLPRRRAHARMQLGRDAGACG